MRRSAGFRLTLLIGATVVLAAAVGAIAQIVLLAGTLDARARATLDAELDGFAALYDQRRIISVRQAIEFRQISDPAGATLMALADRRGGFLAITGDGWTSKLPVPDEGALSGVVEFTHDGRHYIGRTRNLAGGFPLFVARNTDADRAVLARMIRVSALGLLGMLVLATGIGWLASRWVLARVNRVNDLADRVAGGDLSARLEGARSNDEFGRLEQHFEAMLDRVEALNQATTHLGETIAHEMRTPLGRISARLEKLGDTDDAKAAQADIRDTVRVFDSLLEIARARSSVGARMGLAPVDLSALLAELHELYEALAEDRSITFTARIDPGVTILADRNLVALLVSNLFENALKFTPSGEQVSVDLRSGDARHRMQVADTGPGVAADMRDRLFDRFARGDNGASVPGHGLGLALVRAVALRHGAKVSLPDREKGFAIVIDWPRMQQDT